MMLSTPRSIIRSITSGMLTVQTWTPLPAACARRITSGVARAAFRLRKSASVSAMLPTAAVTMWPVFSRGSSTLICFSAA